MSDIAINCLSVAKRFGSTLAVEDASLILSKNRILALLGPSGCGKTTMLRLFAGFEVPDSGVIRIGERVVVANGVFVHPEKRKVGMVFQDYALFPHLDVAKNVAYGLSKSDDRSARVGEVLSLVGLNGFECRMPHELSGGQQQRVALARALVPQPDVILLDEPFSNLDATLRVRIRREVRQILKAAGATAVFVTHDQEEALSLADEVAVMLNGRIVQVAEPENLYRNPATREIATFVGDADFLPGEGSDGKVFCELGFVKCQGAVSGKLDVMLRPENVDLIVDPESLHEVVHREFFGHDQLFTVRLSSGNIVRSRMGPRSDICVGDRVRIAVSQDVLVFPRHDEQPAFACATRNGAAYQR